jgi:hypothetical protein
MIPQKCEKIGRFASPRAATRPERDGNEYSIIQ